MAKLAINKIILWLISFFDVNGDNKIGFADVSVLVAGFIFTLKMLALIDGPDDPSLWVVYITAICGFAGLTKVAEAIRK